MSKEIDENSLFTELKTWISLIASKAANEATKLYIQQFVDELNRVSEKVRELEFRVQQLEASTVFSAADKGSADTVV